MEPTAGFMTHVTCRLPTKNRDQLRNPTLANRVWATFTFLRSKIFFLALLRLVPLAPRPHGSATGRIYMVPISQHLRAADVGTWALGHVRASP